MSAELPETVSALTTVSAPLHQIVDGITLGVRGRAECSGSGCHASLQEGSPAALRLHRFSDEAAWSDDGVFCVSCLSESGAIDATPGIAEAVVLGRLVTRMDSARQTATLTFRAGQSRKDVLDYSDIGE